jgi:hypothetical protein
MARLKGAVPDRRDRLRALGILTGTRKPSASIRLSHSRL